MSRRFRNNGCSRGLGIRDDVYQHGECALETRTSDGRSDDSSGVGRYASLDFRSLSPSQLIILPVHLQHGISSSEKSRKQRPVRFKQNWSCVTRGMPILSLTTQKRVESNTSCTDNVSPSTNRIQHGYHRFAVRTFSTDASLWTDTCARRLWTCTCCYACQPNRLGSCPQTWTVSRVSHTILMACASWAFIDGVSQNYHPYQHICMLPNSIHKGRSRCSRIELARVKLSQDSTSH
jgi:hypothetical protein